MLLAFLVLAVVVAIATRNYWITRRSKPAEPARNEVLRERDEHLKLAL